MNTGMPMYLGEQRSNNSGFDLSAYQTRDPSGDMSTDPNNRFIMNSTNLHSYNVNSSVPMDSSNLGQNYLNNNQASTGPNTGQNPTKIENSQIPYQISGNSGMNSWDRNSSANKTAPSQVMK